jgi:hypothetical protein
VHATTLPMMRFTMSRGSRILIFDVTCGNDRR